MLNQSILIGRIFALEDGAITIKVPRNEKDKEEVDLITARLEGNVNQSVQEYCSVGDIVGLKGRLASDANGMYLKAEKVTFLTSHKQENDEE